MGKRSLGLILGLLIALAIPAERSFAGDSPIAGTDSDYVIVKYDTPVGSALTADGTPRPLAADGYEKLQVPRGVSQEEFIAQLKADPHVVSAEPDATVFAAMTPNDPYYGTYQASYLNQIGVPAAWDTTTGSSTIVVAVLDTGLDLGHEEFAGRLWENQADAYSDGIDHDGNGCINDRYGCRFINLTDDRVRDCGYSSSVPTGDVMDDHGRAGSDKHSHGTMAAGIVAATGNNGKGVAGVAWGVKIMPIKVLDCGTVSHGGAPSGDMFNVAQGIRYATQMGANVINLSLASSPPASRGRRLAPPPPPPPYRPSRPPPPARPFPR